MKQIFICPFLLFSALTLAAAPRILLAPDASPYEKFAAEELRRVWEISSGVQLTITSDAIPEKGDIVIGTSTNPRIKQQMKQLGLSTERKHEAAVQEIDGVLHLAGQTPRAAVDAVMLFLRENIGARWLWPVRTVNSFPNIQRSLSTVSGATAIRVFHRGQSVSADGTNARRHLSCS